MYASYDDFVGFYGPSITQQEFNRHIIEATQVMDDCTSGVDNVHKLQVAMPENSQIITYCACKLVHLLSQMESADGLTEGANGPHGVVSSVSAGNESISYATPSYMGESAEERKKAFAESACELLRGVEDANGVNLLYMGRYPVEISDV